MGGLRSGLGIVAVSLAITGILCAVFLSFAPVGRLQEGRVFVEGPADLRRRVQETGCLPRPGVRFWRIQREKIADCLERRLPDVEEAEVRVRWGRDIRVRVRFLRAWARWRWRDRVIYISEHGTVLSGPNGLPAAELRFRVLFPPPPPGQSLARVLAGLWGQAEDEALVRSLERAFRALAETQGEFAWRRVCVDEEGRTVAEGRSVVEWGYLWEVAQAVELWRSASAAQREQWMRCRGLQVDALGAVVCRERPANACGA